MNEPVCPNCGGLIDILENVDDSFDTNSCEILVAGICFSCGREYQWREVYTFSHIKDLKECKSE